MKLFILYISILLLTPCQGYCVKGRFGYSHSEMKQIGKEKANNQVYLYSAKRNSVKRNYETDKLINAEYIPVSYQCMQTQYRDKDSNTRPPFMLGQSLSIPQILLLMQVFITVSASSTDLVNGSSIQAGQYTGGCSITNINNVDFTNMCKTQQEEYRLGVCTGEAISRVTNMNEGDRQRFKQELKDREIVLCQQETKNYNQLALNYTSLENDFTKVNSENTELREIKLNNEVRVKAQSEAINRLRIENKSEFQARVKAEAKSESLARSLAEAESRSKASADAQAKAEAKASASATAAAVAAAASGLGLPLAFCCGKSCSKRSREQGSGNSYFNLDKNNHNRHAESNNETIRPLTNKTQESLPVPELPDQQRVTLHV